MLEMEGLIQKASVFLHQMYEELNLPGLEARMEAVEAEIRSTGTYTHTAEELEHGARMAWRNSNRCIGRLFWKSLIVRDKRDLETAADVFDALIEHIDLATNKGKILPMITIFKPQKIRIWNHQLIAYAGYPSTEGKCIGDPKNVAITKQCVQHGWKPEYGRFDLLPLLIQTGEGAPTCFDLPKDKMVEVPLTHPEYPAFASLGIRWYAVPLISDMALEIGGIVYEAAPFNGWYMVTEIGSRNLGDKARYDLLLEVATAVGLQTGKQHPLWKDKALVILNEAVHYSYQQKGITLVDHHTASDQFMKFMRNERNEGRDVQADWTWIVPPMSASSTAVFHQEMSNEVKSPNFYYNNLPYEEVMVERKCPFHIHSL